jgi:hypothetical protein
MFGQQTLSNLVNPSNSLTTSAAVLDPSIASNPLVKTQGTVKSSDQQSGNRSITTQLATRFEREPNDTFAQAATNNYIGSFLSTISDITSGTVSTFDDKDYYAIDLGNSINTLTVSLSANRISDDVDLRIYTASGNFVKGSANVAGYVDTASTVLAAGRYYIEVDRYSGADSAGYSLNVNVRESVKRIVLNILEVHDDDGDVERNGADFYADASINNVDFASTSVWSNNSNHIYPTNWQFSLDVPLSTSGLIPVNISIYDKDTVFDDQVDINANSGETAHLFYNLDTGIITGDGITSVQYGHSQIEIGETGEGDDARILFTLGSTYF